MLVPRSREICFTLRGSGKVGQDLPDQDTVFRDARVRVPDTDSSSIQFYVAPAVIKYR